MDEAVRYFCVFCSNFRHTFVKLHENDSGFSTFSTLQNMRKYVIIDMIRRGCVCDCAGKPTGSATVQPVRSAKTMQSCADKRGTLSLLSGSFIFCGGLERLLWISQVF